MTTKRADILNQSMLEVDSQYLLSRCGPVVTMAAALALSVFFAACGAKAPLLGGEVNDPCLLLSESAHPADTLHLAVNPAPLRRNLSHLGAPGDRLLYRQLMENLFYLDCLGRAHPSIASAWESSDSSRVWNFEIHTDRHFNDGTPITVDRLAEVLSGWLPDIPAEKDLFFYRPPVDSVRSSGDRQLQVFMHSSFPVLPADLGSRLFAVAIPDTAAHSRGMQSWSVGSSSYVSRRGDNPSGVLMPVTGPGLPVLTFDTFPSMDPRDQLAQGADLMISSDADVIAYARARPELMTLPLPSNRVYVLLSTTRFIEPGSITGDSTNSDLAAEAFAGGAVRADIRPPARFYWWDETGTCGLRWPPLSTAAPRPSAAFYTSGDYRIAYDRDDPVARDIAERLVAVSLEETELSASGRYFAGQVPRFGTRSAHVTSIGLGSDELGSRLRKGQEFAFVFSLPPRPDSPCAELKYRTQDTAPWLMGRESDFAAAVVPLLETRPYLITRDNHPALYMDWFGNIVLGRPQIEQAQ